MGRRDGMREAGPRHSRTEIAVLQVLVLRPSPPLLLLLLLLPWPRLRPAVIAILLLLAASVPGTAQLLLLLLVVLAWPCVSQSPQQRRRVGHAPGLRYARRSPPSTATGATTSAGHVAGCCCLAPRALACVCSVGERSLRQATQQAAEISRVRSEACLAPVFSRLVGLHRLAGGETD